MTKKEDGTVSQGLDDIESVYEDCALLEDAMMSYSVTNYGPDDIYKMTSYDPDIQDVSTMEQSLRRYVDEHPDEKVLIVYILACHSIIENGTTSVLLNEFDDHTRYYRMWKVE